MAVKRQKAVKNQNRAGTAARLSPLEYEIAVWTGRGAEGSEIASRLGLPLATVKRLIGSAIHRTGCRGVSELEEMFEPDWARLDEPTSEPAYVERRWRRSGVRVRRT
jgi:DNA-binding CsgD family transcriptional regulator